MTEPLGVHERPHRVVVDPEPPDPVDRRLDADAKAAAACRRDKPSGSTASTTRSRRSEE